MPALVPSRPDPMLDVLANFRLKPSDTFKIVSSKGVLTINRRKASGEVESMRVRAKGSFKQYTTFDPKQISKAERRQLEADMIDSGLTQSEVADLVGVSQATVSLDLKRLKAKG